MNKTEYKTKAVAFLVVPNDFVRRLIVLNDLFNDDEPAPAEGTPVRQYHYLFMTCFEDVPGAEMKVFNALNNRFPDISAGLNGGWSMEEARRFMQDAVLEETGVVTCCIPMDTVKIFGK